jgi:ankyrin repeat protein
MKIQLRSFPIYGVVLTMLAVAACTKPAEDALKRLTRAGQSLTADDFIKAAGQGDLEMLGLFLQAGMDRNAQDGRGYTALIQASENGRKDVVRALLQEGVKTDFQTKDGNTAVIAAAGNNQADCVRLLIEANADVNLKNAKNWTALMKAVYQGHLKTTDVMLKTSRDALQKDDQLARALMVAALLGHQEIAKSLLDAGAPVNKSIEKNQTALMYAASTGKSDMTQLLLSRGADPSMVNAEGSTASILALQKGHADVAKMIDTYAATGSSPTNRTAALSPNVTKITATPPGLPAPVPATASPAPVNNTAATAPPVLLGVAAPAPVATTEQDAAAARMEQAWLREKKVDPQSLLAVDTGQDSDGDGWTDAEEISYGTDPHDPNSHPPLYTKLRMVKLDAQPFPVVFDGVEGKKASLTIQHGQMSERYVLAVGARIPGESWKIVSIHPRKNVDKSGTTIDVSELTLINAESGEKLVLVKSMQANSPGGTAVLSLEGMDREVQVKEKQQFSLSPDGSDRYTVLDIRPTQVVLKVNGTGEVITVSMRQSPAGGKQ